MAKARWKSEKMFSAYRKAEQGKGRDADYDGKKPNMPSLKPLIEKK